MSEDWLPIYDHLALGTLQRAAYSHLRAQCVGCGHWHTLVIADLIATVGPATSLAMLARRLRCGSCAQRGAHVEPDRPPGIGSNGYAAWGLARRRWLRYQLDQLRNVNPPGKEG